MPDTVLRWAVEPSYVRLFIIYLIVVGCISIFRFATLTWYLYSPTHKRLEPLNIRNGEVNADLLAETGLANNLLGKSATAPIAISPKASKAEALRVLDVADGRFRYLWGTCFVAAQMLMKLQVLTLLLSVLVAIYGTVPTFNEKFSETNLTGTMTFFVMVQEVFARLALGLSFCAVLYAVAAWLKLTLLRRRTAWEYFLLRTQNDLAD